MLDQVQKIDLATEAYTHLTAREREIALLAMSGLRNKAIACELHLCEGTVKIHLHNIFRKLGVKSRTALLVRCRYS
jgi:DNA-binding NarL/FixJ family response regulator